MTAQEKLDAINAKLDDGATVFITNPRHSIKVTPACRQRFADRGDMLFMVAGESLYVARGKSFDCIDYCRLSATK